MTFFGKKKVVEEKKTVLVYGTSGKIDDMSMALITNAADQNASVRESILNSLREISHRLPDLILSSVCTFISKNKPPKSHEITLLNLALHVVEQKLQDLREEVGSLMISLAVDEMTKEKDVDPDIQQPTSRILVILGQRFPLQVLEKLMALFPPGQVPHYFIIKTIGELASASMMVVPALPDVIARIVTVLSSVKSDNLRWAFATSIGLICDSVTNYFINLDQAPNKNLSLTTFGSEIFPCFDVLFNNWLQSSREPKVRLAVVQSIGYLCNLLEKHTFEAQYPRVLKGYLELYKKEKDLFPVSQGLCLILDCAVKDHPQIVEPSLKELLMVLHPIACAPVTMDNPAKLKNFNEVLRIFEILGRAFSDFLVTNLLLRLDSPSEEVREGTLKILKHLVNRLDSQMEDKKSLLVSGLKPLALNEKVLHVKKCLAQVIIAMASQNYLKLEGGHLLIDFILVNSSISEAEINSYNEMVKKKKIDPRYSQVSPLEMRNMCDNILHLITTTVPAMEDVLWPYLLCTVIPKANTNGLAIICKCLAHIASLKREQQSENYIIDFTKEVNLPKPPAIIARLLVMVNAAQRRGQLGNQILNALRAIGPVLHPLVVPLWDSAIPKLISYIEKQTESGQWSGSSWEDLVMRLLSETIKVISSDEWTLGMAEALSQQLELYNGDPDLKRMSFKHFGVVLQKLPHKEFVRTKLVDLISSLDHKNDLERQGCAQGIGLAASSHLDIALDIIQDHLKKTGKDNKKGGLLGMFSSNESEGYHLKCTLMLAYGHVAAYAPISLVTSRLDVHIINPMKSIMVEAKPLELKESIVKAIDLIGKSAHPSHLQKEYILTQRDDLLKTLVNYLSSQPPVTNEFCQLIVQCLGACSVLIQLQPPLPKDMDTLLLDKTLALYKIETKIDEKISNSLFENLNDMLGSLLSMEPSMNCLVKLLKLIEPWSKKKETYQRERACSSISFVLKKYIEYKTGDTKDKHADGKFMEFGYCLAIAIPRIADPVPIIRKYSIESVLTMLYIDYFLKKFTADSNYNFQPPPEIQPLVAFGQKITTVEVNEQYAICQQIGVILTNLLDDSEVLGLFTGLFESLRDVEVTCSSAVCVVLNTFLKHRGSKMGSFVSELVDGFVKALDGLAVDQVVNGTLHSFRSYGSHHLVPVLEKLLKEPLPHTPHVVKMFQVLAKDEKLVMPIVDHIFNIINNSDIIEEKGNRKKPTYVPVQRAMAATCAIGELLQTKELEEVVKENYFLFFSSIMLRIGTAAASKGDASQQIINTFKNFITCAKDEDTLGAKLNENPDNWKMLGTDDYHIPIFTIANQTCQSHHEEMNSIFQFMLPYLRGNFSGQRLVTAAVFAEFVNHCNDDPTLLSSLINALLIILSDPQLKLFTLRGLGNVVSNGQEEVNKYGSTILDALMSSIDDHDDTIAMEAMNGLSKLFSLIDEGRVAPTLVNICHRIKPAFSKSNNEIRGASFKLFGSLYRFGESSIAAQAFYEQIHANLPTIVVHINEDLPDLQKSAKGALLRLGGLLVKGSDFAAFLNKTLNENETRALNFDEFLKELAKLLVAYFPERLNYYVMTSIDHFKSEWSPVRAAAAVFVGFLLYHFAPDQRKLVNLHPGLISSALISLLSDKNAVVREKAAFVMGLLYTY